MHANSRAFLYAKTSSKISAIIQVAAVKSYRKLLTAGPGPDLGPGRGEGLPHLAVKCGASRSFSWQTNSINSVSTIMRWCTVTVHGLV